jgi:uncharacterized protein (DUF433 family)
MPTSGYVEIHNGGYYVAGTRVGLDVVTYDFRRGRAPEAIFEAYPSIGSLAKVYGAITFILEHPAEVDAYLKDQERAFEEIKTRHPMAPEMIERFERPQERKAG